jgi:hypothetical protein
MSDIELFKWNNEKNKDYINSVPKGTPVFIYGKAIKPYKAEHKMLDESNEFFLKRQLGLDEEEQFYEDT